VFGRSRASVVLPERTAERVEEQPIQASDALTIKAAYLDGPTGLVTQL
jgi:hypothetical protein